MPNFKKTYNTGSNEISKVFSQEERSSSGSDSPEMSNISYNEEEKTQISLPEGSLLKTKEIYQDEPEGAGMKSVASFFREKGVILKENWNPPAHIGGKIVEITDSAVIVECLINKQKKVYQIRKFPKSLFNNLLHLKKGNLILISIRFKAGSQRIDIIDAKGLNIVKQEDFEYKGNWEGIDDSLSQPLPERW
ncbi:MAG: hypothetical protein R6V04_08520 [bacterium]